MFFKAFSISIDKNRIYGLDILRAFAILTVMVEHSSAFIAKEYRSYNQLFSFDGVSIFFVLSGFLIGGILIKILDTNKIDKYTLLDFWIKRWFRTVPPYMLVLIIVILLSVKDYNFSLINFRRYFIFLQNFAWPHPFLFMEAWSLSIEEWFYLIIPTITIGAISIGFKPRYAILYVSVSVLIVVTAYRYYKYLHFPIHNELEWDQNFRKIVITRLDSLMYGLVAAYLNFYHNKNWLRNNAAQLTVGIIILFAGRISPTHYGVFTCVLSFSLNSIAVMLMLPYLANIKLGSGFVYKLITRVSLISYSMYLLNYTIVSDKIIRVILRNMHLADNSNALGYFCFWSFTIVLSLLMYNYFEVPFIMLRNKFIAGKMRNRLINRKNASII